VCVYWLNKQGGLVNFLPGVSSSCNLSHFCLWIT
jgi:hypothetical protein